MFGQGRGRGRARCLTAAAIAAAASLVAAAPSTAATLSGCSGGFYENPVAYVGQTLTITAQGCPGQTISGSVQWEVSTDGGTSFSTVAGATTSTLTISGATNAIYTPVYSDVTGGSGSFFYYVNILPVPTLSNETVPASGTAAFQLQTDWLAPDIEWQVSTDGGSTWSDASNGDVVSPDTLQLPGVTNSQSGEEVRAILTISNSVYSVTPTSVTTAPATLIVGSPASAPPTITTDPAGVTTVCPGTIVKLSAAAGGSPALSSVQWQDSNDNGGPWANDTSDPGNTTDTLSVTTPAGPSFSGGYRAVFSNGAGSAETTLAAIQAAPLVDNNGAVDSSTDVYVGQSATVSVTPDPCYKGVQVQWLDGYGNPITGATSTTYTTPPLTSTGWTEYQPQVTYGSDGPLTFEGAEIYATAVPSPAPQWVLPGEAATFSVAASQIIGGSTLQWQVSTNGGATWSNDTADAGATTDTLTVSDPALTQTGDEYRLGITDPEGTVDTTPATLTVETTPPPTITQQPSDATISCAGVPAILTAAASGTPTPTVQWQLSTDGGVTWTNDTTDAGNTTDTLSIIEPESGEAEYRAVFTNTYGSAATDAVTVDDTNLLPPPPFLAPGDQTVFTGQSATFSLFSFASCYASQRLQWMFAPAAGGSATAIAGATSPSYTVSDATAANAGTYALDVTSATGISFSAALDVDAIPAPASETVTAGSAASLTLGSASLPNGSKIQWQVSSNGGSSWSDDATDSGATTATLSIADATTVDNGLQYRAAITDSVGTIDTPAATLGVRAGQEPIVSAVAPSTGTSFSLVLIEGSNFSHVRAVDFGSGHPALFLPLTGHLIVALAPPESAGTVDVTVRAFGGTSAATSTDKFTYR